MDHDRTPYFLPAATQLFQAEQGLGHSQRSVLTGLKCPSIAAKTMGLSFNHKLKDSLSFNNQRNFHKLQICSNSKIIYKWPILKQIKCDVAYSICVMFYVFILEVKWLSDSYFKTVTLPTTFCRKKYTVMSIWVPSLFFPVRLSTQFNREKLLHTCFFNSKKPSMLLVKLRK